MSATSKKCFDDEDNLLCQIDSAGSEQPLSAMRMGFCGFFRVLLIFE